MIGNAQYQCSCVRYVSQDNTALIVGLCVGFGLLLIIIVVIIGVVLYRRHQSKQEQTHQENDETGAERDNEEMQYSSQLPGDYIKDEMSTAQQEDDNQYLEPTSHDYIQDSNV